MQRAAEEQVYQQEPAISASQDEYASTEAIPQSNASSIPIPPPHPQQYEDEQEYDIEYSQDSPTQAEILQSVDPLDLFSELSNKLGPITGGMGGEAASNEANTSRPHGQSESTSQQSVEALTQSMTSSSNRNRSRVTSVFDDSDDSDDWLTASTIRRTKEDLEKKGTKKR